MMRMTQTGGTDGSTGRRWTLWGTVLLVAALAGCSLTTGYRYADRVILWKLDHYFDLNRDQRQDLARRLTPLLDRHRHEALPQYEAFLKEIRERVKRGLTGSDIDWAYATYDRLRADLVERIVPDGGAFLATIEDGQVQTLESALRNDHVKDVRLVQRSASERLTKRAQTTLDWMKDWLGPLGKEQRDQIRQWSFALPDIQPIWVAYRHQRQQQLMTLLHQSRTTERVTEELRAIFLDADGNAPLSYQQSMRRMRAEVKTMALAVDRNLTSEQRDHAIKKLQRLIDEIHDLHIG